MAGSVNSNGSLRLDRTTNLPPTFYNWAGWSTGENLVGGDGAVGPNIVTSTGINYFYWSWDGFTPSPSDPIKTWSEFSSSSVDTGLTRAILLADWYYFVISYSGDNLAGNWRIRFRIFDKDGTKVYDAFSNIGTSVSVGYVTEIRWWKYSGGVEMPSAGLSRSPRLHNRELTDAENWAEAQSLAPVITGSDLNCAFSFNNKETVSIDISGNGYNLPSVGTGIDMGLTPYNEITYTFLNESNQLVGSFPVVSSSFTPTAGMRLLVTSYVQPDNTSSPPVLSITDSQGLVWTELNNVGTTGGYSWAYAIYAWVSEPVAAVSTTVSVTAAGPPTQWATGIITGEIPDVPFSVAGLINTTSAPTNGGYTRTLTELPTTNDLVIFARSFDNDGVQAILSMGVDWSVQNTNGANAVALGFGTANINSTSVVVVDTNVNDSTPVYSAIDMAFFLKKESDVIVYGSYFWDF